MMITLVFELVLKLWSARFRFGNCFHSLIEVNLEGKI